MNREARDRVASMVKEAFPWLRPPVRAARRATMRGIDIAEELLWRLGLLGAVGKEVQPGFRPISHPTAWRKSYKAFAVGGPASEELANFLRACSRGMVLYDVGAQFGIFSLAALNAGGESSRAYAFDPSPECVRILESTRALNGLPTDRFGIYPVALGDHDGPIGMESYGTIGGFQYVFVEGGTRPASMTTLDSVVTESGVVPTHVKIDVEGLEMAVLKGSEHTLRSHHPLLFVEIHPQMLSRLGASAREAEEFLARVGYRCEWRDESDSANAIRTMWRHGTASANVGGNTEA